MSTAARVKKYSQQALVTTPTEVPTKPIIAPTPTLVPTIDSSVVKEEITDGTKKLPQHFQSHTPNGPLPNTPKLETADFSGVKEDILSGVRELLSQHSQPTHSIQQSQATTTNVDMETFMSDIREMISKARVDSNVGNSISNANKCTDDKTSTTEAKFLKYKHVATIYDSIKTAHTLGSFDHHIARLDKTEKILVDLSKTETGLKKKKFDNAANEIKGFKTALEDPIISIKETANNKKNIFITDFNAATRENPFSSDVISVCEKKECMGSSDLISSTCAALIFKNTGDIS